MEVGGKPVHDSLIKNCAIVHIHREDKIKIIQAALIIAFHNFWALIFSIVTELLSFSDVIWKYTHEHSPPK